MTAELFKRISLYRATMAAVKQMLEQGLITADEYERLDDVFAKKYNLEASAIFR